jgi:hypothetical protein
MNILSKCATKIKSFFNPKINFNFEGGEITSDAGLVLMQDFIHNIGFEESLHTHFSLEDDLAKREHTNESLVMQTIMQSIAGYHNQTDANYLKYDPLFASLISKEQIASQSSMSRFMNRLTMETSKQFEIINQALLDQVYQVKPPEQFLIDIDSTKLLTFGKQYGRAYNKHYESVGYHPLIAFNGLTGDLIKVENRSGNVYTSRNVVRFLGPVIGHYQKNYPDIKCTVRGDSGFATPELYELLEVMNSFYCIRLKSNPKLQSLGTAIADQHLTEDDIQKEVTLYKEFEYKAGSWTKARRVIVKIHKLAGEMIPNTMAFYLTNLDLSPEETVEFYNQRGTSENMIKEAKNGFRMDKVNHRNFVTNVNRIQLTGLAYNLVNSFKRLVLPDKFSHFQIETLRNKFFKIGAKKILGGRQVTYKMATAFPLQDAFYEIHDNIAHLPQLL